MTQLARRWPNLDALPKQPPTDSTPSSLGSGPRGLAPVPLPVVGSFLIALVLVVFLVWWIAPDAESVVDDLAAETTTTTTTSTTTSTTTTTTPLPVDPIEPPPTSAPTPTTTPPPPSAESYALLDEIRDLQKFVETERGLAFHEDVAVELLTPQEFVDHIRDGLVATSGAITDEGEFLGSLGALPPGTNYLSTLEQVQTEHIGGIYDSAANLLIVPLIEPSPLTRAIIVHELTHALDDQWFELYRPEYDFRFDEIRQGFDALVEGDARRIENAYVDSLPDDEQEQIPATDPDLASKVYPDDPAAAAVLASLLRPYEQGLTLVEDILDRGGLTDLNASFLDPPTTTEQVRTPEKYALREPRIEVPPPPSNAEPYAQRVIGEQLTEDLLASVLPIAEAAKAAYGWGGDWSVSWRQENDGTEVDCTRIDAVSDTEQDFEELVAAFEIWAEAQPNRFVEQPETGLLRVTTCIVPPPPPPSSGGVQ